MERVWVYSTIFKCVNSEKYLGLVGGHNLLEENEIYEQLRTKLLCRRGVTLNWGLATPISTKTEVFPPLSSLHMQSITKACVLYFYHLLSSTFLFHSYNLCFNPEPYHPPLIQCSEMAPGEGITQWKMWARAMIEKTELKIDQEN